MHPLLNGIYWGLFLSVLIGPIIFILIQAGVERGFRAGVMIGSGMWVSDMMFILLSYFGLAYLKKTTELPGFELTLGIMGGIMLLAIGIVTLVRKPPMFQYKTGISGDVLALWLKGFLVNALNPFAVFFWIVITTTIVTERYEEGSRAAWFFVGIIGTIMTTDSLKVYLAKGLRKWLTRSHILLIRRISGIVLMTSGIVLIMRVML